MSSPQKTEDERQRPDDGVTSLQNVDSFVTLPTTSRARFPSHLADTTISEEPPHSTSIESGGSSRHRSSVTVLDGEHLEKTISESLGPKTLSPGMEKSSSIKPVPAANTESSGPVSNSPIH